MFAVMHFICRSFAIAAAMVAMALGLSLVPGVARALQFSDVSESSWYYSCVCCVSDAGVMCGYDGTDRFGPDDTLTRGQVATMLYRCANDDDSATFPGGFAASSRHFTDVPGNCYYTAAADWCYEQGYMCGDSDSSGNPTGTFRPDDQITREEFATTLWRFCGKPSGSANIFDWADGNQVSSWARAALSWAASTGVMTGRELPNVTLLAPQANTTRAEAAKMLMVSLKNKYEGTENATDAPRSSAGSEEQANQTTTANDLDAAGGSNANTTTDAYVSTSINTNVNTTANTGVSTTSAASTAANQSTKSASECSSVDLFNWAIDHRAEYGLTDGQVSDFQQAIALLTGSGRSTACARVGINERGSVTYEQLVNATNLGSADDATSLDNVSRSIEFVRESNSIRNQNGLSSQDISPVLMAMAEMDINYCAAVKNLVHPQVFNIWENIAFGFDDPFSGWYTDEKALYESGNRDYEEIGHYTNLLESSPDVTGYAISGYFAGQTFMVSGALSLEGVSVDLFERIVNDFRASVGLSQINDSAMVAALAVTEVSAGSIDTTVLVEDLTEIAAAANSDGELADAAGVSVEDSAGGAGNADEDIVASDAAAVAIDGGLEGTAECELVLESELASGSDDSPLVDGTDAAADVPADTSSDAVVSEASEGAASAEASEEPTAPSASSAGTGAGEAGPVEGAGEANMASDAVVEENAAILSFTAAEEGVDLESAGTLCQFAADSQTFAAAA